MVSNINDIMLKSNNIILDNKKEEEDLKISVEKKDEKKFKDIGEFLTSKENSKFVNLILSYLNKEEQMTFVLNNKKFIPYLTTIIENYKEQFEKKCQINSIFTLEQKKIIIKISKLKYNRSSKLYYIIFSRKKFKFYKL